MLIIIVIIVHLLSAVYPGSEVLRIEYTQGDC